MASDHAELFRRGWLVISQAQKELGVEIPESKLRNCQYIMGLHMRDVLAAGSDAVKLAEARERMLEEADEWETIGRLPVFGQILRHVAE